ncbi:MAG: hypothetical protein ABI305_03475, partial [Tepidiformaceae bacterium]
MRKPARTAAVLLALLVGITALAGCTAIFGPNRDSSGRVTETTEIDSTTLLRGDCFSFVDGTNNSRANVTPCAKPHTYLVIGGGTLSTADISKDGGTQDAVSAACSDGFEAYKKRLPDGTKTDEQFVVSPQEKDGKTVTLYLCVASTT